MSDVTICLECGIMTTKDAKGETCNCGGIFE